MHSKLTLETLTLESGRVLSEVDVAYLHYGRLAPDGRNAILVTHGYTAGPAMLQHGPGVAPGSWAGLIGPGKPLDTDRYFILCSNMLGSCYGTTGPASLDPATGQRYGARFPAISMADIVGLQRRLLQRLGVTHLRAVVGPSYGGFQALQWALSHPDWVSAIGVIVSGPYLPPNPHLDRQALLRALEADPAWRQGRYEDPAALRETLAGIRHAMLRSYRMEDVLRAQGHAPAACQRILREMAWAWAGEFDAHALLVLLAACEKFDARPRLGEIRADMLYVVANSDILFPPDPEVLAAFEGAAHAGAAHAGAAHTGAALVGAARAGRTQAGAAPAAPPQSVRTLVLDTPFGHQAAGPAHALWSGALADLIEGAAP